jgi:hypothetical protein
LQEGRRGVPAACLSRVAISGFRMTNGTPRHLVVLLHGIVGFRWEMALLARALRREGFSTLNLGYPSTRRRVAEHAAWLAPILRAQAARPEVGAISYVGHSLGALVLRHVLAREVPPKSARLVMLAPPNRGAAKADLFRDLFWYRMTLGTRAGADLGTGPDGAAARAGRPRIPFAIIAGGFGDGRGLSDVLAGDDDGTVRVAETELEGAADRIVIPRPHTAMLFARETAERVAAFLRDGRF